MGFLGDLQADRLLRYDVRPVQAEAVVESKQEPKEGQEGQTQAEEGEGAQEGSRCRTVDCLETLT